ncbi:MAG: type II toxin-antitoxin system Phd/YefM family antitoxin [Opitutaceae bacterium]|nr:type II toxin-antitoxin system Phd/YefM family antitoxin [Opitutaceae bacterium]
MCILRRGISRLRLLGPQQPGALEPRLTEHDKTCKFTAMASFSLKDIFPLSDFQRNTKKHLQRLKKNRRPSVLTVNGKPEAVVIDARVFEEMRDRIEAMENVEKLRAAIQEADERKLISSEDAFAAARSVLKSTVKHP